MTDDSTNLLDELHSMSRPAHPGEYVREELFPLLRLSPFEISDISELASRIRVSQDYLQQLVHEKVGITPEAALGLSRIEQIDPMLWMQLQAIYDLWHAYHGEVRTGELTTAIRRTRAVQETPLLIAAGKLEGTAVRRPNGDSLGRIEYLMIDLHSGKVAYAVMSFGGFLGIGDEYRALPWSVLKYNEAINSYELNIADEQLRGAPSTGSVYGNIDRVWERKIHEDYGAAPYWVALGL